MFSVMMARRSDTAAAPLGVARALGCLRPSASVVVQRGDDLPDSGAAANGGAAASRSPNENDPRVLVHAKAPRDVSLYEVRPRLAEPLRVPVQSAECLGVDPGWQHRLTSHAMIVLHRNSP